MRDQVIRWTERERLVAIVRGIEKEKCLKVAQALYDGGVRLMEVTYDQKDPDSWKATAETVGELVQSFRGKMMVGAGTVTTPELVELTHSVGGLFIVSPDTNERVIRRTRELGMVSMPGAMTPSEIMTAHHAGADIVKLFPAGELGSDYLKAVCAPISHVKIIAFGGINEKNIKEFLAAGAIGVGVSGKLFNREWIEAGEYERITESAKALLDAAK